ncbi:MAG: type II toxin-antitoxin system PemK/MazF family toxin [Bacteroidales bacterium]|nr:type II toxin-antitoxin system PemK/MazF family toxin [Bacteroidales bacterium]
MKQGEIWLINLDPTIGAEMKKTRPAVIVNDDQLGKLPLRVIVPITDWKEHYSTASWMVAINPSAQNGLTKKSSADCFQIRSVSKDRLIKQIGSITSYETLQIQEGIARIVSLI